MRAPVTVLALVLVGGAIAGGLATRWYDGRTAIPDAVVRDLVATNTMPDSVADRHRSEHYRSLDTVAAIFGLPTAFARSEALYALAGRSDAAALQQQIFAADRIADDIERDHALGILFFRLAELDPPSALALARTDYFEGTPGLENTVWSAWARKDFEDALFAAKTQPSSVARNVAAQALYAAFGFMGNPTTDRIEQELGIGPDRSQRARYLYRLADRSPREAIEYVEAMPRGTEKTWNVDWLAHHLSLNDGEGALSFARHFTQPEIREQYESVIRSETARENPGAVIERYLVSRGNELHTGELRAAIETLAETDPDHLLRYWEQAGTDDSRSYIASFYVQALARADPRQAIQWARDNDRSQGHPMLLTSALMHVAESDPELAVDEALKDSSARDRGMLSNVFGQISQSDPYLAMALLDKIEHERLRERTRANVVSNWLHQDPDGAIEWIESLDRDSAQSFLVDAGPMLAHHDVDAARRLLPRVPDDHQAMWRGIIAQQLAIARSPAEAMSFARQFEGEPGYAELQSSVIAGMAERDVAEARQYADQLGDVRSRDAAYEQIAPYQAQQDPREALSMLSSISDPNVQGRAAAAIVGQWYESDAESATSWVLQLPAGVVRDQAVRYAVNTMHEPPQEMLRLVDNIADPELRVQAKVGRIYQLMSRDRDRARELLDDPEIPDYLRNQLQEHFDRY